MTAPARITQADWDRAAKSVKNAGHKRARIVGDLANGRLEIIIGADEGDPAPAPGNTFDED